MKAAPAERHPAYHHGDLRAALIQEGLRELAVARGDDLSLREIARAVGVSANAVYRHFPDKAALMAALAEEGLDRLAEAQRQAAASAPKGITALTASGRAYVRFALANPALFRLIFSAAASPARLDARGQERAAFTLLKTHMKQAGHTDRDDKTATIRRLRAWSTVHGLAMLMLDNQIPPDAALIDAVISPTRTLRPKQA